MFKIEIRKLIRDKRTKEFSHLGEPKVRSFESEAKAAEWTDKVGADGFTNWEKYEVNRYYGDAPSIAAKISARTVAKI